MNIHIWWPQFIKNRFEEIKMKRNSLNFIKYSLALCGIAYGVSAYGQTVFPTPAIIEKEEGSFVINKHEITVQAPDTAAFYLKLFATNIVPKRTIRWEYNRAKADVVWIEDKALPKDAYEIRITEHQVKIKASDNGGFIYAVQTLRQWISQEGSNVHFPCARIEDAPRVTWRCFMLDSGRQYQQIATLKKYIDMTSLLKMNYFHWHLTEGLGWRIDIRRYPRLAKVGGSVAKGKEQQGYYTQEEIRELVHYAAARNVTIVPEIDMPGHAEAALFAYPELGCFGDTVTIPLRGFTHNIFCAGKDSTVSFLKNVLDEVCALFPSPYIHLGGDEAPKENWNKCPDCQTRIKTMGLKNSHDLQLWFSAQMASYLKTKGKKAVFWGDVVYQDGYVLPDNVVIQWWNYRGHKDLALRNALQKHIPVICSSNYYCYLNFPITPWRGYNIHRTFNFHDVYTSNPSDEVLKENNPLVLGMTAALWTDDGVTEDMIDIRLFPRIFALAEQMWCRGKRQDVEAFYTSVLKKKTWFEQHGFRFGPGMKE